MIDSPLIDSPRSRRPIWLVGGVVVAALLAFVLVWFQPHKLVIDDTVSEPLPGLDPDAAGANGGAPAAAPTTTAVAVDTTTMVVDDLSTGLSGALGQAAQSGAPQIAASSEFISLDHGTSGTALVVALPDGALTLRFENLDTSNGPDLRVVLTPHAADSGDYEGRLELGRLKGNRGDQNYDIPPGTDLTAFRSVVIWCERFSSPFGAAPVEIM